MTTFLLILFSLSIGIQLLFILFVFARTAFHPVPTQVALPLQEWMLQKHSSLNAPGADAYEEYAPDDPFPIDSFLDPDLPGVSVIVCAWNELPNLRELLPLLNRQVYPSFEVLVMNDRSSDGTIDFLENEAQQYRHIRFISIDREHDHITPKKYALTIGIRQAKYDLILLTDADCRPVSPHWIAGMMAPLHTLTKEIVLGFSPYEYRPGLLNRLIHYETLYTAVQYFSLALAGQPYMGVGRNLLYKRHLFLNNKGFYSHNRILGGDDDLFINEVAKSWNVMVSLHPDTFMVSKPKETIATWYHQKRRHLSVGQHYRTKNKIWLSVLSLSHVLTWLLGLIIGILALFNPGQLVFQIAGGLVLLRLILFWWVIGRISQRLGQTVSWWEIPLLDLVMSTYYSIMGITMFFLRQSDTRHKRMTWR